MPNIQAAFRMGLALWGLSVFSLYGQEFRGTMTGTVTDAAGAVIPGAKVEVQNTETNVTGAATTNESGSYVLPFLTIGHYDVTASAQGFKQSIKKDIELRVGDR